MTPYTRLKRIISSWPNGLPLALQIKDTAPIKEAVRMRKLCRSKRINTQPVHTMESPRTSVSCLFKASDHLLDPGLASGNSVFGYELPNSCFWLVLIFWLFNCIFESDSCFCYFVSGTGFSCFLLLKKQKASMCTSSTT